MTQQTPPSDSGNGIAVIGMACRLPGAVNLEAYRQLLLDGRSGIVYSDDAALRANGIPAALLTHPHLVRRFGVLADVEAFDAAAFGIPPARAQVLDPQQRVLLELAVSAMEHAGYAGETDGCSVGVYVSLAHCSYRGGVATDAAGGFFGLTASDKDYGATRISYALDLTGPSLTVQSACSGSLAALHMAVEALLSGQCDMALAGGASILLPQGAYIAAPGLMLAADGHCRPFDAVAAGTVPGNGAGLVVLKRLDRARADGDTIHAVVRGSAIANDGARKVDYLAPGIRGQMRAVGEAWSVAGIEPASLGMIEAHGTGTALGDPIEINALSQVFGHFAEQGYPPPAHCRIGSVKANIGHLNVASGIAGFIKTVLALRDGIIPGTPGFQRQNPDAPFANTPLTLSGEPQPWTGWRRAGVSSFGFGGTNVHVVLEQPPERSTPRRASAGPWLLPLSAHDPAGLERLRQDLAAHLRGSKATDFEDVAFTLQRGRTERPVRAILQASDPAEAAARLAAPGPLPVIDPLTPLGPAAQRWLAGESLAWERTPGAATGGRIPLPTYPFARERHWLDQHPTWPLGATGREMAAEPTRPESDSAANRADPPDLRTWLIGLFAETLQREPNSIPADSTYDQLGIDSLLVVSITGRIRELFPEVHASLLFEHKTLDELAAYLAGELPDNPAAQAAFISRSAGANAPTPAAQPLSSGSSQPAVSGAIAIIGLAGRFPGGEDPVALWDLLENGRSAIGPLPDDRDWPAGDDEIPRRKAAFIDGVYRFDALFFGIAPTEARRIDPQARLFLETAWSALEDAGYTPGGLKAAANRTAGATMNADVGVFAGVMNMPYRLLAPDADRTGQVVQANHWSVANRVSYHFDFTGPSLAVDTACSASLTALHLACESLRRGECGAAVAGGVNLILDPVQQRELVRMGMLSPTDVCHSFGVGADGFVQGEGVGAVVLKTLEAAQADGDRILGVILGSAANANGRTGGYTVPNPTAQSAVVRRALDAAGISAASVSAIECHGTGTALGDPIEIAGLAEVFDPAAIPGKITIGSIKSNMGHLESAAGIAGLAKLLLQFQHRRLAPSLNAAPLNPELRLDRTCFRVATEIGDWEPPRDPQGRAYPRRAGLSGFGAGGANVHVLLEEAPASSPSDPPRADRQPILLSAADTDALERLRERLARRLADDPALAKDAAALADLAYTLATGRESQAVRTGFMARDRAALLDGLAKLSPSPCTMPGDDTETESLLRRWLQGERVDWTGCWQGERRRRIALPTYPFQGPSLRLMTTGAAVRHERFNSPWLSGAGPSWRFRIDAAMPLLDQHRVADTPYLPGVVSAALAMAAAEAAGAPVMGVADLVWKKPIAPGPEGLWLALDITQASAGRHFQISLDGVETLVEGRLLGAESMPPTEPRSVPMLDALAPSPLLDQEQVRQRLAASGLRHGPVLRAIHGLRVTASEMIAELARPEAARRDLDGWNPCPALLDSAFQAACTILLEHPEPIMPLPLGIERLCLLENRWPDQLRIHARLRDRSAGFAQLDIVIGDMAGRPVCLMQGLTARLLPGARKAEPVPLFAPRWRTAAADASALLPDHGRVAIIAPRADHPLAPAALELLGDRANQPLGIEDFLALPEDRRPEHLFYLHPVEEHPSQPPAVLRLLDLLAELSATARPLRLILLTLRVHATRPGEPTLPWAAAAIGLARTAQRENPRLHIACLDLDDPADLGPALAAGADPLGLPIAWRNDRRLAPRLDRLPEPPLPTAPPVTAADHILIVGGAGGIGQALAERWSQRHGARFTLIGRRSPQDVQAGRTVDPASIYLQADVTDPAALAAAIAAAEARQGPITGAIHAALIMHDRAIRNMRHEDFLPAFDVKRLGLQHLYESLCDRPLRWLCVFSSVNAFVANAGQSNYVAGCVVQDALGLRLAGESKFPVRIVNWGYWGEVGRVATEDYRQRMARIGVHSVGTQEGLDALERILAGAEPQVLAIRAEPAVLAQLGLTDEPDATTPAAAASVPASPPADRYAAARVAALNMGETSRAAMAGATEDYRELDRLAALALADWWWQQSWPDPAPPAALAASLGLAPEHRRQFDALLDMLDRHSFLARQDELFTRGDQTVPATADIAARRDRFLARAPHFAAHFRLLDACLARYASTLRGETAPTEVLFPDMSMSLVEGMYQGNRMVDHFNDKLAAAVAAAQHQAGGAAFRVLEFGSGTGGTSQRVLPALGAGAEYDYTDISPGFLIHGKRRFKADYPFVNFKLFNLENPPDPTEFPAAHYDVAFGANVIHATRSLARSLGHVSRLLRPGGLLMLYEMVANHDFVTLTFGLLPGWWLSEDPRLPHGPLLDPASWRRVLTAHGFDTVGVFGQPEAADESQATHALIIARRTDPERPPDEPEGAPAAAEPRERRGLLRGRLRRHATESVGTDNPEPIAELESQVLASVAATLEIPPEKLDPGRSLADYGADSILGVQLVRDLNRRFGIELKPTTLFSHPSVRAVALHLATQHGVTAAKPAIPVTADDPAQPATPTQAAEDVEAMAVIGMAGRFPGAANVDEFERVLMAGRCSVGPVPMDRWDHGLIHDPRPLRAGRSVCPEGGFIADATDFDPLFFGLSPTEATAMDPQQRLFLMTAWHALEDAGLSPANLKNVNCGVYAGNVAGDYGRLLEAAGHPRDAQTFMGSAASMLPARIAYHLDLKGPALSIDTACSSALVAIAEACEALRGGRCELALAGGVAAMFTPGFYVVASNTGMLSPTGRCHTLDADADGFVPGEAVAVFVLKRLDRAVADRDRILGVIRGWGVNQDGASNGITAPSAPAQASLIRGVHERFAIDPASIDYVELHGTGTRLGDPVEMEGLTSAFGDTGTRCGVGSVKSNVGHTLAAAGAVGLVKTLLALRAETLPPSLHFRALNPAIALDGTPFRPITTSTPWPIQPGRPRRAGVSAFGFAGTNAHVVVEEAAPATPAAPTSGPWLFTLSARTPAALGRRAAELAAWLDTHPDTDPAALAATLATGRMHFKERAALVANDLTAVSQWLAQLADDRPGAHEPYPDAALQTLADRYVEGDDLPLDRLWPAPRPLPLSLPGYPFERRAHRPALTPQEIAGLASDGASPNTATPGNATPESPLPSILAAVTGHLDQLAFSGTETSA